MRPIRSIRTVYCGFLSGLGMSLQMDPNRGEQQELEALPKSLPLVPRNAAQRRQDGGGLSWV